jgi:hypothetical protein
MKKLPLFPEEIIQNKIYLLRGEKVMFDHDLAQLYGVQTKRINEQVKRNSDRFPSDFMFRLSIDEWDNLKSHFATSSWGGRRTLPYVFTEHGVLVLTSELNSEIAIKVIPGKLFRGFYTDANTSEIDITTLWIFFI